MCAGAGTGQAEDIPMHFPSELDTSTFSIQVLNRQINCYLPEEVYIHDVFTKYPLVENPDAALAIEESEGPLQTRMEKRDGVITMRVAGENAFNMNRFRSYVGYLVHHLTPAMFIHGCGIYSIIRKKGVLFVGTEGSGKTTVSREIPHAYIIDDDQILLCGNELIGIGKKAARTEQDNVLQKVVYEDRGHRRVELGIIFTLTKEMEGGKTKKVSAESVLQDTELVWHHNLHTEQPPADYCKKKEVPDVPSYLVGTNGKKPETVRAVIKKIDTLLKDG